MEFWELLFFTDLILMILLFLWKFKDIWLTVDVKSNFTEIDKRDKMMFNFLHFFLNTVFFGIALFIFMNYPEVELLIPLTMLITGIFLLNVLFFIIQLLWSLKWKADEAIVSAHGSETMPAFSSNFKF